MVSRGFCNSCPRDSMLVIGDEIIETPMAWPCRYFETHSYRPILKDYFRRGARWTAAPRPQLTDELFDAEFRVPKKGKPISYILTEFEPVFDAADFFRCGRDLFVTRSNVTNASGIEWLRRHLGGGYRIHEIESRCPNPMHIDTSILPLGPGKILINPEYIDVDRLPAILKQWDILVAPEPDPITDRMLKITSLCGKWLNMTVLTVDGKRVIVDPHHTGTMRAMEKWDSSRFPASSCTMPHLAAPSTAPRSISGGAACWRAIFEPSARSTSRRTTYQVIFSPMMPERMRPIQLSLSNVAGSLNR